MIVAIQQPEHLPWLGFFDKMRRCDLYVLLDNVQFKKRYFENRNKILTANGPQWVTVPVISKGRYTQPINQVMIDNTVNWRRKYLGSVQAAYGRTPYFPELFPRLEAVINKEFSRLADLNIALIEMVRDFTGIDTPMRLASDILPDTDVHGSDLILALSRASGADHYISGPDGRNYLDLGSFLDANIKVSYHDYNHPAYEQTHGEFSSHMSAVDALFNVGKLP
ncbi:WbqC family protein [Pseudodesulfovibrio sp.]|uniref:WbqC family protein n=1 Tax=unclassified Pseudodesulfovibrio TaxID=2661612 RepID=UPI003B00CAF7